MKDIGTEEKLDVISQLEKGELNVTYAVMFHLLTEVYGQFKIMLIELKKVLSVQITLNASNMKQGLFVCVTRLP